MGGGASGLAAAIASARSGARVLVIERDIEIGTSLLATGNGRCNLSNDHLHPEHYLHPEAARAVMGASPEAELADFFASIGLPTTSIDGWRYPLTKRAASVQAALLAACKREQVALLCASTLERAQKTRDGWILEVRVPEGDFTASPASSASSGVSESVARRRARRRALAAAPTVLKRICAHCAILAVGGRSAAACSIFDLEHEPEEPVLCPIACEPKDLGGSMWAPLDGLRIAASVQLLRLGQPIYEEAGELLFRPYGISGIMAFNLSRRIQAADELAVDLVACLTDEALGRDLAWRAQNLAPKPDQASWFTGLLAPALADVVLAALHKSGKPVHELVRSFPLKVLGRAEERSAQIHRGGIPLSTVDLKTLCLRSGLYAAGEVLDQDADCGGFNLAWAWISGLRAGYAAAHAVKVRLP
ncbi:NAD(P)/FAD-dependent oxidoreductase [Collinsella sp. AGMB00827]|uniref:NAD(P)/FAD-dependent oxidoreductase n=2 Tax=Collinsella ureilytica TaxID=2869515 RepID=A0ABS7MMM9_9ACTN|nr:NAD(P)/FAD-dependent oxidoreductase [Collinsella urealyticum]